MLRLLAGAIVGGLVVAAIVVMGPRFQQLADGQGTDPNAPGGTPAMAEAKEPPQAALTAAATMIAGKRIDVDATWSPVGGKAYLERVSVLFAAETGEILREIPFPVGETSERTAFVRRFPLEPGAGLFGICFVYGASKDGPRAASAAWFVNKGEGESSPMRSAPPGAADAQKCLTPAPG
jgi:hypothetical protein